MDPDILAQALAGASRPQPQTFQPWAMPAGSLRDSVMTNLRSAGMDKLKRGMWGGLGVQYQAPGSTTFNDMPVNPQVDYLKQWADDMERRQKLFSDPQVMPQTQQNI